MSETALHIAPGGRYWTRNGVVARVKAHNAAAHYCWSGQIGNKEARWDARGRHSPTTEADTPAASLDLVSPAPPHAYSARKATPTSYRSMNR